ncbi:hypothetical protein TSUD_223870 [Trifolium subterraneum]|uniref:Uncharacterized protein n=1 Tax=Trifolium subterraneum TaxID=3900 RepID=A0A2Z6MDC3_TRISU|nr:hypothetical protein TSUD_223870 [Trifolium subterraneum]
MTATTSLSAHSGETASLSTDHRGATENHNLHKNFDRLMLLYYPRFRFDFDFKSLCDYYCHRRRISNNGDVLAQGLIHS